MTSATDAAGVTTYYEYDALQRLKQVKDLNGNIVRQNIYHYKGQP
jgi:YD repeat-containing protein